jgi:hypothetical protein
MTMHLNKSLKRIKESTVKKAFKFSVQGQSILENIEMKFSIEDSA